jgi:hypothetical protein
VEIVGDQDNAEKYEHETANQTYDACRPVQ